MGEMTRDMALEIVENARTHVTGAGVHGPDCDELYGWCVDLVQAAEVLAQPAPDRWVVTGLTTKSGQAFFRCGVCGRLSETPDENCPEAYAGRWGCNEWAGEMPVEIKTPPGNLW